MPSGPRILIDNACYHIVARANQKQRIFKEHKDYKEYLDRLRRYKTQYNFKLYTYCLMPNHVHMLGEIGQKENLSNFMHDLTRSYTEYFNKKYDKVGYLWQGRFKSRIIVKDRYLIDCMNYIELNPVKDNLASTPHEYPWSSYVERTMVTDKKNQMLNVLEL